MGLSTCRPSAFLSPFVKQYWAVQCREPLNREHTQTIIPTGLMELSFYLEGPPVAMTNRAQLSATTLVTGQQTIPHTVTTKGDLSLFSVTFRPQGAMAFLGLPLCELAGLTIPLRLLHNANIDRIEDALAAAKSFQERVAIIEAHLTATFLRRRKFAPSFARISDAISMINQTRGAVSVSALAARASLSPKQFERVFAKSVGLKPKSFLRVVRFQNAIHHAATAPDLLLTALAHESRYFDQSHMIREFQALAGTTPRQFFDQCAPVSDYFS